MVIVTKKCYRKITSFFSDSSKEHIGLIGARKKMWIVSDFSEAESFNEKDFCVPDKMLLNETINNWADNNICFCGIVHSHIGGSMALSQNDVDYIQKTLILFRHLPYMFFPIVSFEKDKQIITFYRCRLKKQKLSIKNEKLILRC